MTIPTPEINDSAFGLYLVITNPRTSYEMCAEAAVQAGIRYVQLRMKRASRDEILLRARNIKSITAGTQTRFIVNDDPSIAEETQADGVHVGQSDMNPNEIRRLYPGLKLIGLSTHSFAEAQAAIQFAPTYIGVGPVFATPTKEIPDNVLGCAEAGRIIKSVEVSAVAIGSIDVATLPDVLKAGAVNFAVVRAVCASPKPYEAILHLMAIWHAQGLALP